MDSKTWVDNYNELNNSFKKKLVFRVGIQAGLFSEINHMYLAILFCLKNEIKFVLSSQQSNFSFNKGWQDYFLPFCQESEASVHLKYNARSYQVKNSIASLIRSKLIRSFYQIDYLTQDVWPFIRDAKFQNEIFDIPQLQIKGSLINALQVVVNHTWRYQPQIQAEIDSRIKQLNLPANFAGLHVRAGDKATEAKLSPAHIYISELAKHSPTKNIFVLTDDHAVISSINTQFPDFHTFTFVEENERGFSEGAYNALGKSEKKAITIKLLANTEVLYQSAVFVGTYSSNVGIFVGMRRNAQNWFGVDAHDWRMW